MFKSLEQVSREAGSEEDFVAQAGVTLSSLPDRRARDGPQGLGWWHCPEPALAFIVPHPVTTEVSRPDCPRRKLGCGCHSSPPLVPAHFPRLILQLVWQFCELANILSIKSFLFKPARIGFCFWPQSTLSKQGDWVDSQTISVPFSGWCWRLPSISNLHVFLRGQK